MHRLFNRWRAGAVCWIASALLLPVQVLVAQRWPGGYSITENAISDLGVTYCGPFVDGNALVRDVCSPWHLVFNAGVIASGILMVIGAFFLHGWWTGRSGRAGTILMALAGACVIVVGFTPWNLSPDLHDGAAFSQALAQWFAMLLLARAAGPGHFRLLAVVTVVISISGFVSFLAALQGMPVPLLGFGIAERISFDSLTLWTAVAGIVVLASEGRSAEEPPTGSAT